MCIRDRSDRSTSPGIEDREGVAPDDAAIDAPGGFDDSQDPNPAVLDEAGLEALLFVAERPLSRREIASLAGVGREEVDARLGDLEVSLRDRGVRLVASGD